MSSSHGNFRGDAIDTHLKPEERAAIAAVDGVGVLTPEDASEVSSAEIAELEAAAGALFTAFALENSGLQEPPSGMLERLQGVLESHVAASADDTFQANASSRVVAEVPAEIPTLDARRSRPFGPIAAIAGWATAAALLAGLLSTIHRVSDLERGELAVDPQVALTRFQLTAPDVRQLDWQLPGEDSAGDVTPVRGAVIWSDQENRGFMRIQGLSVNDPAKSQYQLWIFRGSDPSVEPHPVDGGVFDVASSGEVIIPIDAKLEIGSAALFAVTVEKPGGVVVSDRSAIVALAVRAS